MDGTAKNSLEANDPVLKQTYKGHKDVVHSISFHPTMRQIASGSADSTLFIWNLKQKAKPYRFLGHKGPVLSVAFSPQGNHIASGSKDETVKLWTNSIEGNSTTLKAHTASVRSVNFSCDGNMLLTASDDKSIKLWSVIDKKFQYSLLGHSNWVRSAQFSPDVRLIGSGGDDKLVKIWDTEKKQEIQSFSDHTGVIYSVRFHPDGTCLASSSFDKKIKIFDIRSRKLLQHYDAHSDGVNEISFHPSGSFLLSASSDAKLKIWDLRLGKLAYTLYGHEGSCTAATFSAAGDFFATGGNDSLIMLWKSNFLDSGAEKFDEQAFALSSSHLAASHAGTGALLGSTRRPQTANPGSKQSRYGGLSSDTMGKTKHVQKSRAANKSQKGECCPNEMTFSPGKGTFAKSINYSPNPKERAGSADESGKKAIREPGAVEKHVSFSRGKETGVISHSVGTNFSHAHVSEKENLVHASGKWNQRKDVPEEVSKALDMIIMQLDVLNKTMQTFEMRIDRNESQITKLNSILLREYEKTNSLDENLYKVDLQQRKFQAGESLGLEKGNISEGEKRSFVPFFRAPNN